MIKTLLILLNFAMLRGESFSYLLPDANQQFSRRIEQALSSSDPSLVVTPKLHHGTLKRSMIKGANRGASITLIVASLRNDPLYLAQYERIDVRTLSSRPMEGSVIIVGSRLACLCPAPLDEEFLTSTAVLAVCTDEAGEVEALRKSISPLLRRSEPYLK